MQIYSSKYFPLRCGRWAAFDKGGVKQHFDTVTEAEAYSLTGPELIDYNGYQIAPSGIVFKNGVQAFCAPWQRCESIEDAKQMIDRYDTAPVTMRVKVEPEMNNYEAFQLEKYGNVIAPVNVTPEGELYESGLEELDRFAEWMNVMAERENN